ARPRDGRRGRRPREAAHGAGRRDEGPQGRRHPEGRGGSPSPLRAHVRALATDGRARLPRALAGPELGFRRAAAMRPSPYAGVAGAALWLAFGAFLIPVLVPPAPAYRTAVVAVGLLLLGAALVARRAAFVLALLVATGSGISAFLFGGRD